MDYSMETEGVLKTKIIVGDQKTTFGYKHMVLSVYKKIAQLLNIQNIVYSHYLCGQLDWAAKILQMVEHNFDSINGR